MKNGLKIEKLTLPTVISKSIPSPKLKDSSMIFSFRRNSILSTELSPTIPRQRKIGFIQSFFEEESSLDIVKRILMMPSQTRDEEDIKILVKILRTISFFETLGVQNEQNIIENCCRYFNFEFCPKGNYVFHYGSQGSKFYIILSGTVGVLVPKFGKVLTKKEDLKEIRVLKSGEAFGELALISKKTRSASILAKEDCCFAVLDKKYFFEILCINNNVSL